jgi:hypothetical protein
VSENAIDVDMVGVDVGDIIFEFNQGPCTTALDEAGQQNVATPVDVSVFNYPGACSDTLVGAMVIEPDDRTCVAVVAPVLAVSPLSLDFGTTPGVEFVTISNTGGAELTWTATATGDGVFSVLPTNGILQPGTDTQISVTFSLDTEPGTHSGAIVITAAEPTAEGSPQTVVLAAETP